MGSVELCALLVCGRSSQVGKTNCFSRGVPMGGGEGGVMDNFVYVAKVFVIKTE